MSQAESGQLDIVLMGREFRVACAESEQANLKAAVTVLEGKLREIADQTRANGEKLAVMTALNLAMELVQMRNSSGLDLSGTRRRMKDMQARIDEALAQQEQLF